MIYSSERDQLRRVWYEAWRKARIGETLTALEQIIATIIHSHPEYHALLEDSPEKLQRDWHNLNGGTNPFLHLSMHLALHESISTNHPLGVREIYTKLVHRSGNSHATEHQMMECLAEVLWNAQRQGNTPDEKNYVDCLRRI